MLRMQLVSVTYPSLHRVCECSIIENDVDLWARRTLDSMTAGTVEDLVETILYTARMYERSKGFERIYVHHSTLEKDLYDTVVIGSRYGMDSNAGGFFPGIEHFCDGLDVAITYTCDKDGRVYSEAALRDASSEQILARSGRMYEFCNHYIVPYKGAEYHIFIDILPESRFLEKTIYISETCAETIEKYLRGEELQGMGESLSETATFPDGFDMDIRCCGTEDDSFTEAILYDSEGKEVALTEPCDTFTGCWELEDDTTGTKYRVHVMTKSRLN